MARVPALWRVQDMPGPHELWLRSAAHVPAAGLVANACRTLDALGALYRVPPRTTVIYPGVDLAPPAPGPRRDGHVWPGLPSVPEGTRVVLHGFIPRSLPTMRPNQGLRRIGSSGQPVPAGRVLLASTRSSPMGSGRGRPGWCAVLPISTFAPGVVGDLSEDAFAVARDGLAAKGMSAGERAKRVQVGIDQAVAQSAPTDRDARGTIEHGTGVGKGVELSAFAARVDRGRQAVEGS